MADIATFGAPTGGVQTTDRLLLVRPGATPAGFLVPVPAAGATGPAGPAGPVGPAGPAGPAGSGAATTPIPTGAAVSGKRIVMVGTSGGLVHAEPGGAQYNYAGMALETVASGVSITPQHSGVVENPGWTWTPGQPLYAGPGGVMNHAAPTAGVLHKLGYAISATRVLLMPEAPIQLA